MKLKEKLAEEYSTGGNHVETGRVSQNQASSETICHPTQKSLTLRG